ncbi:MAG: tetratricopeptide repeat protein [Myxococcota bacterium]
MTDTSLATDVALAEQVMLRGDYREALRQTESIFEQVGDDAGRNPGLLATAHYIRGVCRTELRQLAGAIADFQLAAQLEARGDGDARAMLRIKGYLAVAYDYDGQSRQAERIFRESAEGWRELEGERAVEYGRALSSLGVNLEMQGKCDEALRVLRSAIEVLEDASPTDQGLQTSWSARGNCASRVGDLEGAIEAYGRGLSLVPEGDGTASRAAVLHHNLAFALAEAGRTERALVHARQTVEIRTRLLPADHPWRLESEALLERLEAGRGD